MILATAAAAVADLYLTAGIYGEIHGSGTVDKICGLRAIVAAASDDFSSGCIDCCTDHAVLCCLRSGELESEDLLILLCDAFVLISKSLRGERVEDGACVGVLVFDDVASGALDGVSRVASLRCEIVVQTVDGSLRSAAAIGELMTERVYTALHVVAERADRVVNAVEALKNGGVHAVEALAKSLLDTCLTAQDRFKAYLDYFRINY